MAINPILNAKLKKYIADYELSPISDDAAFERFVNYHLLLQRYPRVFETDSELLDLTCLGGGNDLGIDGIAISVNGRPIRDCLEIDDILKLQPKCKFEITFIQTKNKEKFDLGEFTKFTGGVIDFLNEGIQAPTNDAVKRWHDIWLHIISEEIITKWDGLITINVIYCTIGNWDGNKHILGHETNIKRLLNEKGLFEDINFGFVDGKKLINIVNSNESSYEAVLSVLDSMPLPEVERVDNSSVILCAVTELLQLLTYEKLLRRNLFIDNVRDYQGDTAVNQEILVTLEQNANEFVLLNNGITIVCDEMREVNRKITLKNPQVVNGCQTCNVLYKSWKNGENLEKAYVIVKVIASSDSSIVNNIIKGTNRQNIVYDEAFEITRDFHKLLEEYFKSYQIVGFEKVYYERRSKQFEGDENVKPTQKVNFRFLIQSFVSLFLYKVEDGHHHEAKLLQEYKDTIFKEEQSYHPYYLAGFLNLQLELMFRRRQLDKPFATYKYHILLIIKERIGGKSPDINRKKEIENYCKSVEEKLKSYDNLLKIARDACNEFNRIKSDYVKENGYKSRFNIKDNPVFTNFLLDQIRKEM